MKQNELKRDLTKSVDTDFIALTVFSKVYSLTRVTNTHKKKIWLKRADTFQAQYMAITKFKT